MPHVSIFDKQPVSQNLGEKKNIGGYNGAAFTNDLDQTNLHDLSHAAHTAAFMPLK